MNRRTLLRGLFAAPAIVAASSLMPIKVMAALAPLPPHLYGDGIHDDTAALQWIIDNHKGPGLVMPSGRFLISSPVKFINKDRVAWSDASFVHRGGHEVIAVESGRDLRFNRITVWTDHG